MKKYYLLPLICFLFYVGKIHAQSSELSNNTDQFSNIQIAYPSPDKVISFNPSSNYHFYNPYTFNPAMAGIGDKRKISLDSRYNSFSAAYEQPIVTINSAIGIQYEYQIKHFGNVHRYGLAYNYGFRWKENTQLKIGVQFSQINISIGESSFFPLEADKWHKFPSLDFGIAFQFKQLRLGASVQNLVPKGFTTINVQSGFFSSPKYTESALIFSAANTFSLSKRWDWSLAFLLRFSDQKYFGDFNFNSFSYENEGNEYRHDFSTYISFDKKYSIGATYRTQYDGFVFICFAGLQLKKKLNLLFSCNVEKDDFAPRYWEALTQYKF